MNMTLEELKFDCAKKQKKGLFDAIIVRNFEDYRCGFSKQRKSFVKTDASRLVIGGNYGGD